MKGEESLLVVWQDKEMTSLQEITASGPVWHRTGACVFLAVCFSSFCLFVPLPHSLKNVFTDLRNLVENQAINQEENKLFCVQM